MARLAEQYRTEFESLWHRFLRFAWLVAVLLVLSGVGLSVWLYRVHHLSVAQTQVLEVEATTAHAMLDAYRLMDALDRAYDAQDAQYLEAQLSRWLDALRKDENDLDALRENLPQNSALSASLLHMKSYLKDEYTLGQTMVAAAKVGNWPSAKIRLRTLKITHRKLLLAMQQAIQESEQYRRAQFQDLQRAMRHGSLALPIATVVALVLLAAAAVETRRLVIQPLNELVRQVDAFAEGDFTQRVTLNRQDEIGRLAHTFNLMADRIQQSYQALQEEVERRTQALQRRTAQLQAATEIGRAVSALREVDELLAEASRLIAQRYGYYHVGVFLTQEGSNEALLRGAYNRQPEVAQRLLAAGYAISILGEGVASRALATGRPHAAQFGEGEYPLEALPATRAELAIPLRSGEEILGVLDVHMDQAGAFSPEDITALQAVADLLSIALTNARLLQETENALKSARQAYDALARRSWQRYLRARRVLGYRIGANEQIQPVAAEEPLAVGEVPSEPEEVVEAENGAEGELALSEGKSSQKARYLLRLPVRARGRVVALAHLRKSTPWKPAEKRLLQRLAERVGIAMEAASLYAQAQRSAAQLQIAAEIARDASATLDLDELLRKAVHLVKERFGFYHASVFLLDERGEYAYVRESTGEAGRHLKERRHRLAMGSHSVVGQTLARREVVVVNDVTKSDIHHFNPLLPETRAEVGIPLLVGDELIGVLDVQSAQAYAFGEEDIRVLRILADQLAIAVINARLFAVTRAFVERSQRIREVTAAVVTAGGLQEAYRAAVEGIARFRPRDVVSLWVPDRRAPSTVMVLAAVAGKAAPTLVESRPRRSVDGDPLFAQVVANRQVMRVTGGTHSTWHPLSSESRAAMLVPIIYAGELSGVLMLESALPGAYEEQDLTMSQELASSLGAVFANVGLLEQVREHARRLQLLYEITAAAASQVDLSALLADLTRRLQEGFDLLHCGVVLFDENGQTGTLVASASAPNAPAQDIVGVKLPLSNPLIEEARRTHRPVICRNIETDPRVADIRDLLRQRATKQLIVVPLLARDEVIGTLGLDIADLETEVTEDELRLLEQIAHQIATSVEVARLFQQAVRTAERERLVTEITTKIRASNDPREILQTAVEELRRALRAHETQIVFVDDGFTDE